MPHALPTSAYVTSCWHEINTKRDNRI